MDINDIVSLWHPSPNSKILHISTTVRHETSFIETVVSVLVEKLG